MRSERLKRREKMGSTCQHIGLNYCGATLVAFRVVFVHNTTKASEPFACFSHVDHCCCLEVAGGHFGQKGRK